jgi:hypothetical protein
MDQNLWVFEVFRKSPGMAKVELTKVPKSGGGRRKKGKTARKKEGPVHGRWLPASPTLGRPPADNQRSGRGRGWPAMARSLSDCGLAPFFPFFWFSFLEIGLAFWENGCTTPPFFEACPYTWKC